VRRDPPPRKAVQRLATAGSKTARQRLDSMHKTSATLASRYALVATEELRIANLTRSAAEVLETGGEWLECTDPKAQAFSAVSALLGGGKEAALGSAARLPDLRAHRAQRHRLSTCGAL